MFECPLENLGYEHTIGNQDGPPVQSAKQWTWKMDKDDSTWERGFWASVCVCPVSQFEGVSPPFVAMDTPRIVSHEFFVGGQLEKHQLLGGPSFHQVEIL